MLVDRGNILEEISICALHEEVQMATSLRATTSEFDYVNTVFIRSVKVRLDLRSVSSCSQVLLENSQIISHSLSIFSSVI